MWGGDNLGGLEGGGPFGRGRWGEVGGDLDGGFDGGALEMSGGGCFSGLEKLGGEVVNQERAGRGGEGGEVGGDGLQDQAFPLAQGGEGSESAGDEQNCDGSEGDGDGEEVEPPVIPAGAVLEILQGVLALYVESLGGGLGAAGADGVRFGALFGGVSQVEIERAGPGGAGAEEGGEDQEGEDQGIA